MQIASNILSVIVFFFADAAAACTFAQYIRIINNNYSWFIMQIMDSVERAPKIAFIFYCCCCSDVVSELLKVKIIEFQQNSFRTACNAEPAEIYLYKYIGSTNKENEKHFLL